MSVVKFRPSASLRTTTKSLSFRPLLQMIASLLFQTQHVSGSIVNEKGRTITESGRRGLPILDELAKGFTRMPLLSMTRADPQVDGLSSLDCIKRGLTRIGALAVVGALMRRGRHVREREECGSRSMKVKKRSEIFE